MSEFELLKARWRREEAAMAAEVRRRRGALRRIPAVLRRFGVTKAFMFGSTCRNRAGPRSDIDLYVEPSPGAAYWDLRRALEQSVGYPIDLHDPSDDSTFVARIKAHGECIYEAE